MNNNNNNNNNKNSKSNILFSYRILTKLFMGGFWNKTTTKHIPYWSNFDPTLKLSFLTNNDNINKNNSNNNNNCKFKIPRCCDHIRGYTIALLITFSYMLLVVIPQVVLGVCGYSDIGKNNFLCHINSKNYINNNIYKMSMRLIATRCPSLNS